MSQEGSPVQDFTSYQVSAWKSQKLISKKDKRFEQSFLDLETAKKTFTELLNAGKIDYFSIYEVPGERGCENIPVFDSTELSKALAQKKLDVEIDSLVLLIRNTATLETGRMLVKEFLKRNK